MKKDKIKNKFFKSTIKIAGNKGLGKNFLGKSIKKYLIKNSKTDEIIVNGCKMQLDKNDVMQISLFDYEPIETDIVKSNVKKNDIVVDVGANIGLHTLNMARIVGNTGQVFAFEPDPSNFEILKKNVKINNYKNIILEQKAVGDKHGRTTLYQSDHPGKHRIFPQTEQAKSQVQVELTNLDNYFDSDMTNKINFIKIDVEGLEFNVLKGMKNILKNSKKIKILFEFMPENTMEVGFTPIELLNYLTSNDFKLYCLSTSDCL